MENKIIELTQSKEGNHCLTCGADNGHVKVRIQRMPSIAEWVEKRSTR